MKLLHTVPTLSQTAGGLPVAVVNLCRHLDEVSLKTEQPADAIAVPPNIHLLSNFEQADLIHQHGIWSPSTIATSRYALKNKIRLVISPHGMLEPWAIGHHSLRKKLAWHLYQRRFLQSAAGLHVTSQMEADQLRSLGLTSPIAVIPHGIEPVSVQIPSAKPRRVLFLSRLHKKKGLDLLIDAWNSIDTTEWELQISGTHEGWSPPPLPTNVTVTDPLYGEEKEATFASAALFILPSYSENFGLVIAEALQRQVPVITTTTTPWQQLVEHDCGWWVDPTVEAIADALTQAFSADLASMGKRGADLIATKFSPETAVARMRNFYDNLCR